MLRFQSPNVKRLGLVSCASNLVQHSSYYEVRDLVLLLRSCRRIDSSLHSRHQSEAIEGRRQSKRASGAVCEAAVEGVEEPCGVVNGRAGPSRLILGAQIKKRNKIYGRSTWYNSTISSRMLSLGKDNAGKLWSKRGVEDTKKRSRRSTLCTNKPSGVHVPCGELSPS